MKMLTKIALLTLLAVCSGVEFQLQNLANYEIWVGILGSHGLVALHNGGLILAPGQKVSVQAPENWGGRFWGRTGCNQGTKHCETGDCGNKVECAGAGGEPPATLAEITLKGDQGKDFYDISLVDGYNIPVSIAPVGGQGDGSQYSCKKSACSNNNIIAQCPEPLKVKNGKGTVVACNSACNAYHNDEYCCRNAFGSADTCKAVKYGKFFKDSCPDAYSFAFNDQSSTFTCKAQTYVVTFG